MRGSVVPIAGPPACTARAASTISRRNAATATSLALDGTYIYWTTSHCDIRYVADSPQ